jgi:dTDP-4-dehydrorhamnose 3,5-epimerase
MKFIPTALSGVVLIEPDVHRDARGYFLETYHQKKYQAGGVPDPFVQDNHSSSVHGTLRGLHAQLQYPQGKLVRVLDGEIYDVAVDLRPGSPTFGRWIGEVLSSTNFRQLYVPQGFAHGFLVLSETADVQYKCTDVYHPEDEISLLWNDPEIGVAWPLDEPLLNDKDRDAPRLQEILPKLDAYSRFTLVS